MLSQASTYAIRALQWVANQEGRTVGIGAAAAAGKMPVAYLAKIVNQLARRKLVLTQRGVGGGVLLARPASQITLYDTCGNLIQIAQKH